MDSQVMVALALSLVGGFSTSLGALFVILNQAPNLKMLGLLQGLRVGLNLALAIALPNIPEGVGVALPVYFATQRVKALVLDEKVCTRDNEWLGVRVGNGDLRQTPVVRRH